MILYLAAPCIPGELEWIQFFAQNNFAPNNPYGPRFPAHQGLDGRGRTGTLLYAMHAGAITFAGLDPASAHGALAGYGWWVEVTGGVVTRTCHMLPGSIPERLLRDGAAVIAGDVIGRLDSTGYVPGGEARNNQHTHIEVHCSDPIIQKAHGFWERVGPLYRSRVNPLAFMPPSVGGLGLGLPVAAAPRDPLLTRIAALEASLLIARLDGDRNRADKMELLAQLQARLAAMSGYRQRLERLYDAAALPALLAELRQAEEWLHEYFGRS